MPSSLFVSRVFLVALFAIPSAWAAPKFQVLHNFGAGKDGITVPGSLTLDAKGDLYGTTAAGGSYGKGTVFKLTLHTDGQWTVQLLHNFRNNQWDGTDPSSGVILDNAGHIYANSTNCLPTDE